MKQKQLGTSLVVASGILLSTGIAGCASSGSLAGDAGLGAGAGALLGAGIGAAVGGTEGALIGGAIGLGAGALVGAINFDQFSKRQATLAEANQANANSGGAIAEAKNITGNDYGQVDEIWTPVDEDDEKTTYVPIDPVTGVPTGEAIEVSNSEVNKIKDGGSVVDASGKPNVDIVGGKTVVITS